MSENPLAEYEGKPERYRILKNGAVYDREVGRIVANPGGGSAAWNSETSELGRQQAKLKREAAVMRGVELGTDTPDWGVGVADMTKAMVKIAVTKQNRAAVTAYNAVMRELPGGPDVRQNAQNGGARLSLELGAAAMARLLDIVQGLSSD